jgi:membrane-bound ClpP family serine protease
MNATQRYWLFQLPGYGAAFVVLGTLYYYEILDGFTCVLLFALWVVKDALMYPFLRDSYRAQKEQGRGVLIGMRGKLESDVQPTGWVRLRGELWQARANDEPSTLKQGELVQVVREEKLVLYVERVPEEDWDAEGPTAYE